MASTSEIIGGRYQIEGPLGHGGMGRVLSGRHVKLGTRVAIKELCVPGASPQVQEMFVRQFEIEARILASLSHPNVARVVDFFEEVGHNYLVMDLIEGGTLDRVLTVIGRPLLEKQVLAIASELLDALEYLHSRTPVIIMRDLKPSNVMLDDKAGRVKLIDFGIARTKAMGTQTIVRGMGTVGYAPVEQVTSAGTDERADIYALGATLYFMLTHRHPPDSVMRVGGGDTLGTRTLNPSVSTVTSDAIDHLTTVTPEARIATVAEARAALGLEQPGKGRMPDWASREIAALLLDLRTSPRLIYDASEALAIAQSKMGSADLSGALAHFDRCLELDPGRVEVLRERGELKLLMGDLEGARADFERCIARNPGYRQYFSGDLDFSNGARWARSYRVRAWGRFRAAHLPTALSDFDRLLSMYPSDADAHFGHGLVRCGLGDLDGAIADFDACLKTDVTHAQAYLHRGEVKARKGHRGPAYADIARCLAFDPQCAQAYRLRGTLKKEAGDLEDAERDFTYCLSIDPEDPVALLKRGEVRDWRGDFQGAMADYSNCLKSSPTAAEGLVGMGYIKERLGDIEGALADYDRSLAIAATGKAYWRRALIKEAKRHPEAALADFDRAVAVDPSDLSFRISRGKLKDKMGRQEEALADYQECFRLQPTGEAYDLCAGLEEEISQWFCRVHDGHTLEMSQIRSTCHTHRYDSSRDTWVALTRWPVADNV